SSAARPGTASKIILVAAFCASVQRCTVGASPSSSHANGSAGAAFTTPHIIKTHAAAGKTAGKARKAEQATRRITYRDRA
ncbi:MAG TPA: hypothetical protein VKO16_04905, partial [Polyangia bacterium]|nr:hypothetical protein [Polyangia bacterium]